MINSAQSDANEGLQKVLNLVRQLQTYGNDFSRADMDELAMLADAYQNAIPSRMKNVISEFDKNFNNQTRHTRDSFLERILRIAKVAQDLPIAQSVSVDGADLIPTFQVDAADKKRMLKLCGDMRKIIISATDFDEPHKIRLLNRIAAIENQVHQKKGMLDIVLSGVSDVGETLGKFGKDIKPLSDRMTEVAGIARRNSKQYDQIPAPEELKGLPAPDTDGD